MGAICEPHATQRRATTCRATENRFGRQLAEQMASTEHAPSAGTCALPERVGQLGRHHRCYWIDIDGHNTPAFHPALSKTAIAQMSKRVQVLKNNVQRISQTRRASTSFTPPIKQRVSQEQLVEMLRAQKARWTGPKPTKDRAKSQSPYKWTICPEHSNRIWSRVLRELPRSLQQSCSRESIGLYSCEASR